MGYMIPDRLADAIERGREEGYITRAEGEALAHELEVMA